MVLSLLCVCVSVCWVADLIYICLWVTERARVKVQTVQVCLQKLLIKGMSQHIPDSRYSWPRLLWENILRQSAFPMPKRKAVQNQPDSHGNILKWLVLICSNMHNQYNITVDLNYFNKITQYRLKNIQLNEVFFMYLQPNRCTISEFMAIKYSQISSLLFSSSLNVVSYIICVATYGQSMLT